MAVEQTADLLFVAQTVATLQFLAQPLLAAAAEGRMTPAVFLLLDLAEVPAAADQTIAEVMDPAQELLGKVMLEALEPMFTQILFVGAAVAVAHRRREDRLATPLVVAVVAATA